jgi:hypothetical protein
MQVQRGGLFSLFSMKSRTGVEILFRILMAVRRESRGKAKPVSAINKTDARDEVAFCGWELGGSKAGPGKPDWKRSRVSW